MDIRKWYNNARDAVSLTTIGVSTLQSRAFAGQAGDTFIFCVPGSTGACRDAWDLVLAYELDSRYRPCSLAGQIPRLRDRAARPHSAATAANRRRRQGPAGGRTGLVGSWASFRRGCASDTHEAAVRLNLERN